MFWMGKHYTSSLKALSPALWLLTLCISLRSLARHFWPICCTHVWYFGPKRWVLHFRLCCPFSDIFGTILTWFWVKCNAWLDCMYTNSSACQSLRHSTSHFARSSSSCTLCSAFPFKVPSVGHFISLLQSLTTHALPVSFTLVIFSSHYIVSFSGCSLLPYYKLIVATGDIQNQILSSRDQRGGPHLHAHPAWRGESSGLSWLPLAQ